MPALLLLLGVALTLLLVGGVALRWWFTRTLNTAEQRRTAALTALQQEEHKLRLVTNQLPAVLWTTDQALRVGSVAGSGLQQLGYPINIMQGQSIEHLADVTPAIIAIYRRALSGETGGYEQTVDGRTCVVRVEPLRDATGNVIGTLGLAMDITERKQAADAQQRLIARLQTLAAIDQAILYARAPEDVASATIHALAALIPHRAAYVVAFEPHAAQPRLLAAYDDAPAPDAGLVIERLGTPAELASPNHPPLRNGVLTLPLLARDTLIGALQLHPDTQPLTAEHVSIAREAVRPLAIAIQEAWLFQQVVSGRERLQALSRQLVEVQERERRMLASELHDEIGQSLTGLKFVLDLAERQAGGAPIAQAQTIVDTLVHHVRELSLNLRPTMLDDLGLVPTLHWHHDRFSAQTGIAIDFTHCAPDRYPPEIETTLYRVAQESLTNVARHAGCQTVTVRLWADAASIGIQVADQGVGFYPEAALTAYTSSGLSGMRERVALIGGRLLIDAAPNSGTTVTAELPLSGRLERRTQMREG